MKSKQFKKVILSIFIFAFIFTTFSFFNTAKAANVKINIYRLWNNYRSYHFFTPHLAEKDHLVKNYPNEWRYEGIAFKAWQAPTTGFCNTNDVGVHRIYNQVEKYHIYTEKTGVYGETANYPWIFEAVNFCAPKTTSSWELRNPVHAFKRANGSGKTFYTMNYTEKQALMSDPSWSYQGVKFYGM